MAIDQPLERQQKQRLPIYASEMLAKPSAILAWLYRTFFRHIRVDPRYVELVRNLSQQGSVVYVMRSRNLINYLFFNALCLSLRLPLARFSNGISLLSWQPISLSLGYLWRRLRGYRPLREEKALRDVIKRGQAALLFLRKPRTLTTLGQNPDRFIPELLTLQREQSTPIFLVPQLLIWERRAPKLRRSLLDIIFGEVSDPGLLRQLWLFFRNYKRAMVKVGDPVDLRDFAEASRSDQAIAKNVRGKIIAYLAREFRVVLGPQTKEPRFMKDEIIHGRGLRDQLIEISREQEVPLEDLQKQAHQMLDEIAANINFRLLEALNWFFSKIFERLFDGVEYAPEEFARVRDAARKGPLLIIPSHKSHIDYLLVSWLFHREEIMLPHIAGGENLSFWPLGALFRRGGAFFLRRSFKGDKLYTAVFRAYVKRLVRDGHNIEFFIEGGRSRTGKLLPPKLGLLGMVIDACLEGTGKEVQIVPMSIVYEKVLEDKSYQKELMGGQKTTESVGSVLKASKVLRSRYGRIYCHVDTIIPLSSFLASQGLIPTDLGAEYRTPPHDPEKVRKAVRELAYRIETGINRATIVTPSALVATTLLTHPHRGMARNVLENRCAFLLEFIGKKDVLLSNTLQGNPRGPAVREALQQAIFLFHKNAYLTIHDQGDIVVYSVEPDCRPSLDYYKNNLLHCLIEPALIATALFRLGTGVSFDALSKELKQLSRFFKHEFIFRTDVPFEQSLREALDLLLQSDLLREAIQHSKVSHKKKALQRSWLPKEKLQENVEVSPEPTNSLFFPREQRKALLLFFRSLLLNFFESSWIVITTLESLSGEAISQKELLRRIRLHGERLYLTGEIKRREACLTLNYQNVLSMLKDRGVLEVLDDAKSKQLWNITPPYQQKEEKQKLKDEIACYLKED